MKNTCALFLSSTVLVFPMAFAAVADCLPAPPGLVSWWKGTGNGFDSAGPNDGRLVGSVNFVPGIAGPAFFFSGDGGDYVRLAENTFPVPAYGEGYAPFTFETWFQTTNHGVILGQQDVEPFINLGGYIPALYVGTNGLLYAAMFYATSPELVSPGPVNDGLFHHAAVTHDGSLQTLYIDGIAVASTPMTQLGYAETYYYQLGTGFTGGWPGATGGWFPFRGIVEDPSLYNRALSGSEIAALFGAAQGKCGGPVLRHRFSFNEAPGTTTVPDSIRGGDGILHFATLNAPYTNGVPDGSGFSGDGWLRLNGVSGYVALPPHIISPLSNLTIEAWIAWNGPTTGAWQRIFDFGSHNGELGLYRHGTNYLMLCPSRGDQYVFGFQQTRLDPLGGVADPNASILYGPSALPVGQPTHLALTYDPIAATCRLFVNGALVNSSQSAPLNLLNRFFDQNNWLGRSQWGPDPFFNGAYDEFRIWDGVLSSATIASHFATGPNQILNRVPPALSIARSGQNVILSWTSNALFELQTTANLSPPDWQTVTAPVTLIGSQYQVIVPASANRAFYRLFGGF